LRFAEEGDICQCGTPYEIKRGMELGHIFKLRYAISEPMNATFTDEDGTDKLFIMGCYGIGVSRILAAVAEVNNDENGLIWPMTLAPYKVHLIVANAGDPIQLAVANKIYTELKCAGVDTVFDDRAERAGVKFKDADLMGMPVQIVVGKFAAEGHVEMRDRATKTSRNISADAIVSEVQNGIKEALENLE
jgi:prolyl-tRNA synthetase